MLEKIRKICRARCRGEKVGKKIMPFTNVGTTAAQIELMGDAEQGRAARKAEERHGIQTGIRCSRDGMVLVSVRFYPKVTFLMARCEPNGDLLEQPKAIGRDDFDATWKISL